MDCTETQSDLSFLASRDTVCVDDVYDNVKVQRPSPAVRRHESDPVAELVQQALFRQEVPPAVRERRREHRQPYPYAVYLTPLNHRREPILSDTFVVIGKHLSGHGFDFYHCEPVPHRHVLASFDCGSGRWVGFVLDLSWCRFNRNGWYDNGGRFLETADSPFNQWNLPEDYMRSPRREIDPAQLRSEGVA